MCCCELPSEWPPPLQISPIIKYLLLTGPVINSKIASSLHLRLPLGPEHWIHYLLFSELAGSFHFCPSMEIGALCLKKPELELGNCAQDFASVCTKPAALLQLRDNENLWPSRLSPRFCNPGLWSSQQSSALNEFQFPGFITQPGAVAEDLWLHRNLSGFLRVPVNWSTAFHCVAL